MADFIKQASNHGTFRRAARNFKPVFHCADFSARNGAAVLFALFISNNGHFWSLRYVRM